MYDSVFQVALFTTTLAHSSAFQGRFLAFTLASASFLHPFLQPHRSNSLDEVLASSSVVHNGFQLLGSTHPQSQLRQDYIIKVLHH